MLLENIRKEKLDLVEQVNHHFVAKESFLHVAANFAHPEIVRLLLEVSAKPNFKNAQGNTPLHLVCHSHHGNKMDRIKIVHSLVSEGAKINAKNKHLFTPLHYAVGRGSVKVKPLSILR